MVFMINLETHLADSIRYEIIIITYLIYLVNYAKVKTKIIGHAESGRNIYITNR